MFHYSYALTYLLITFFFSLCFRPSYLSSFSVHTLAKRHIPNYSFLFPLFLSLTLDIHSLIFFSLALTLSHAFEHTRTPCSVSLWSSLVFSFFFFLFFITAFLFFILSRYSNTYVVTRGRASMSIFLEYAINEVLITIIYFVLIRMFVCIACPPRDGHIIRFMYSNSDRF